MLLACFPVRPLGWAVVFCGLIHFAMPVQADSLPGIKGVDERVRVETDAYPWSAVGRFNKTVGGFCTGTVVAPGLVLTAAHCLWNKRTRNWLPPRSLHFVAGYRRGDYLAHSRAAAIAVPDGYAPLGGKRGRHPVKDWALVSLCDDVSPKTGTIAPAAAKDRKDQVLQAGYSQDKAHILTVHDGCRITGPAGKGLVMHDCDATRGDSGSPILVRVGDRYRIRAIHVATRTGGKATAGIAVSAEVFADRLRKPVSSAPSCGG